MHFIHNTLATPQLNLAFDEALIAAADKEDSDQTADREILRVWEARDPFIVLGRSSKIDEEVHRDRAREAGIPVLRRVSGGATILAAPGCMFYTVLIDLEQKPHLRMLDEAHRYVMGRILDAVLPFQPTAQLAGTCDLIIGDRKTSGNALRVGRSWLLYHGTLLLEMDLEMVGRYLKHPPREPDYRSGRNHGDFLANLQIPRHELTDKLREIWQATDAPISQLPSDALVNELVQQKYSQDSWNAQR